MKKAILIIVLAILYLSAIKSKKDFEGIIKFKIEYRDKTGKTSNEQVKQIMGNEQVYYLKKDKYKSELNGFLNMKLFYNGNDTVFLKIKHQDKLIYRLVNEEPDKKILSHKYTDITETIAGIKCKLLKVTTNKGTIDYYYSDEVRIDPKYYENHKFGLWSSLMKLTNGGISIKSISDFHDSYESIELISLQRKKLDDTIFERPNLPIEKTTMD